MPEMDELVAIVPLKDLRQAKQRLVPLLSAGERSQLARAMAEDVLAALVAARGLADVVLVAHGRMAAAIARRFGARLLPEIAPCGTNEAVALAMRTLSGATARGMLVVVADVPLISTSDVEAVLAAHGARPAATLVPAVKDGGTNGLACSPADLIRPLFGLHSFSRHCRAVLAAGLQPRVVPLPGWGRDIDLPEDLADFCATPSATRTYAFLIESRIIDRISILREESLSPRPLQPRSKHRFR